MRLTGLITAAVLLVGVPRLAAQSLSSVTPPAFGAGVSQPTGAPSTPRHTGLKAMVKSLGRDVKHLPSKENLYWVAAGGAIALSLHPFDTNVRDHIGGNQRADNFFRPGKIVGIVGPLAGSVTAYAWGRLSDRPRLSHVGMDLLESQAIAQGLTMGLKYSTRRERPDGSGRTSFPSGHAASTFAFATALERHLGWRYFVPAYAIATYVAASRLPANRHWMSDVVFGAAVGIIAGRTVTSQEVQPYPVTVRAIPGGAVVTFAPTKYNR